MYTKMKYLTLRFDGPLQSWGFDSQYNRRNTALMPTKSAISGMICAAFGYSRGCVLESVFLENFKKVHMISIAIPRKVKNDKLLNVRRMQDYHTVGGGYNPEQPDGRNSITVSAESGKPRVKNGQALAVLTNRHYLTDAFFGVILKGEDVFLDKIAEAIQNPIWGIYLGRKCCIPAAPVFAGLTDDQESAQMLLIGENSLDLYTCQTDVESFNDGTDSISDSAISFATNERQFSTRRIKNYYKKA